MSVGAVSDGREELIHWALLYGSEDEFIAGATPVLREGLEAGGAVLALTSAERMRALAAELPHANGALVFEDPSLWPRRLSAVQERINTLVGEGVAGADAPRLTVLMEPHVAQRWPSLANEWLSVDALANDAWSGLNVHAVCPYDRTSSPPEVVEGVRRSHRTVIEDGVLTESAVYQPTPEFLGGLQRGPPLPEPRSVAGESPFNEDMVVVRRLIGLHGAAAGLSDASLEDLTIAVNEVATNAYLHGGGIGRARVWVEDDAFVCEIRDRGHGLADPTAGFTLPPAGSVGGRGLWLARRLCDALQIRSGPEGTTIRMLSHL
jgi:anti-sigma regulatory factor (Ser/Thr protein kinase)